MEINRKLKNSIFTSKTNDSGYLDIEERIERIVKLEAQKIMIHKVLSQKEAESIVRSLIPIRNINDDRIAEIPVNTIGKIIKHKGYDISRIIELLPSLYETSIFGWSEPEIKRERHKDHPNIKEYHHYINKFSDENSEYYIRFILHETIVKPGRIGKNYIHSTAISNIKSHKKDDSSDCLRDTCTGKKNTSPSYDYKLMHFLNSVKLMVK